MADAEESSFDEMLNTLTSDETIPYDDIEKMRRLRRFGKS